MLSIFYNWLFYIKAFLVPKIIIDYFQSKRKIALNSIQAQNILEQQKGLSDLIVSASIETIEFVLGTVSNTASYLRLWALSLAHSQLAKVFFQETVILIGNISKNFVLNAFLLVIAFPAFVGVTALVLLFMDLMECFLHTLRLHWVEFQNKFYRADGYEFKPFCFAQSLDLKEDDFEKK